MNKKIHFHDPWSEITPPNTGPRRLDRAATPAMIPEYVAYFDGGTISGRMTKVIVYIPPPPMPCKALKTILS